MDPTEQSISALQQAMGQGRTTARGLVEAFLARIDAYDQRGPALNSILLTSPDAHAQADALDRERRQGRQRGPLHGIPVLVKDNQHVEGLPTRVGCRALAGLVAREDAFVVQRLREAGAVLLGKTNLHELSAGITSVGSVHGRVRNPYDRTRTPGGSSGGTAAAVSASFAAAGTASDTCGSIRIPAAFTATVGLRPSQGLTSRHGVVPLALSQDVLGPIARSVEDLALLLDVMVGEDPRDKQTAVIRGRSFGFAEALGKHPLRGRRIGLLASRFDKDEEDEEVAHVVDAALRHAEACGVATVPIEIEEIAALLDLGFVSILAEFQDDLDGWLATEPSAPVRSVAEIAASGLVHPEVAPLVAAAVSVGAGLGEAYETARRNRARLGRLLDSHFDDLELDAIAYPSMGRVAARHGEVQLANNAHLAADSGFPAVSLPAGFTVAGMPVGVELLGRRFGDVTLLGIAYELEQALGARRPPPSIPPLGN